MKKLLLLSISLLLGWSVFAQDKLCEEKRKGFEAQRVAYFTNYLELTPEEAATFWPLYNEMSKKIREKEDDLRVQMKTFFKSSDRSDASAKLLLDAQLKTEQEKLDIKKEYYRKFQASLPAQKIVKIDHAEHTFNKQLLSKMREECIREGKHRK
ncbi:hypothetical protein LJB85_03045 [Porphyromonadaceae bacterium OttesenSCG-928-L07]|nr:hypothetical protein [Porphyromonadaceae bacterium OttesenSCG-928-L07]MDL2252148.1 hypothetical protein [Odoribacter sp. OttesenSCG-928-J03]